VSDFQEWAKSLDQAVWSKNDLNYCKQAWDTATIISESVSRLRTKELEKGYEKLRIATLNAVQLMAGGQAKADLRDAYDAATEALKERGSYDGTPETV
jgi:hypothetical protein